MEILSLGNELPPEINLFEEFYLDPDSFRYENWEGMLVYFPEGEFLEGILEAILPSVLPAFNLSSRSNFTQRPACLQSGSGPSDGLLA